MTTSISGTSCDLCVCTGHRTGCVGHTDNALGASNPANPQRERKRVPLAFITDGNNVSFYVRYYVGHQGGSAGKEFLEFEFKHGKVSA